MKQIGNTASNETYNPSNKRPPVPIDVDEADSAMERFIRAKYMKSGDFRSAPSSRDGYSQDGSQNARSFSTQRPRTPDYEDTPPPPPPKTTSRFGFRSTSSIFPMSSKAKREAQAKASIEQQYNNPRRDENRGPTPPRKNKPSRIFGANLSENDPDDSLAVKLTRLRDMGFTDENQNMKVLTSLNGNMEKSIETLVRLGERVRPHFTRSRSPSRSRTPVTAPQSAGLSFEKPKASPVSPTYSSNPWEIPPAAPQTAQSTGSLQVPRTAEQSAANGQHSLNPFGFATRSQMNLNQQYNSLDQSFQNLSVNGSQQLFPNHTGGAPRQSLHSNSVPPMPSIPQGQYTNTLQPTPTGSSYNPFLPQQQVATPQTLSPQVTGTNPFMIPSLQRNQTFPRAQAVSYGQAQPSAQDFFNQQPPVQQNSALNPFGQPQQQIQQPQVQQGNPFFQQQQAQQSNPYSQQQQSQPMSQNPYGYQQQQPQQLQTQKTGMDKSSIMAMFNYPAPVPQQAVQQPAQQQFEQAPSQVTQNPYNQQMSAQPAQQQFQQQNPYQQQAATPSFITPLSTVQEQPGTGPSPLQSTAGFSGATNPFMHSSAPSLFAQQNSQTAQSNGNIGGPQQGGLLAASGIGGLSQPTVDQGAGAGVQPVSGNAGTTRSRDSMMASGAWHANNGRHSPDAFAQLSARAVR